MEQAVCNPTNPYVLRLQLPCAANELPLNGKFEIGIEYHTEVLAYHCCLNYHALYYMV